MSAIHQPVVLVVEDEPAVRQLSCAVLERAGFTAVPACDATEAMKLCFDGTGAIDLLLTDVQLGREPNGLELADAVRCVREDIAILIMSGTPGMEDLASAKGYAFVAKPFAPAFLVKSVCERLRDSAVDDSTRQPENYSK